MGQLIDEWLNSECMVLMCITETPEHRPRWLGFTHVGRRPALSHPTPGLATSTRRWLSSPTPLCFKLVFQLLPVMNGSSL